MKTLLWTQQRIDALLPFQSGPQVEFGSPGQKHLSKWFYKLDLERFNILVREPIDVVNFMIEHAHWTPDREVHGVREYFPQGADDVYKFLFDLQTEDCDGIGISVASILHTLGDDRVRLAVGYYGNARYADPTRVGPNHVYCLLQAGDSSYKLLDAVGDKTVQWLESADRPGYQTLISASADGRIWIHNSWAEKWEKITDGFLH